MNDGRMNNAMGNGFGMEIGSDDVVRFNILERIGRLSHNDKSGWSKEVNIVAWNDYPPKVDIREWDPNHERMSRGVTLHELEAVKLANMLLKKFPPEEYANNKYQNKGARNRSWNGHGTGNGRSSGYGNSGDRGYGATGAQRYGNDNTGQNFGNRDRDNGYNGNGHNGGNYRDGMNTGYYTNGQSDHYANGTGAQDEYYDNRGNEVKYESMGGQNYGYDEGSGARPQRDADYNNNVEAGIQEFGLMGDGEKRYQACGDAGELYEDYIPGLDAAMPGDGDENDLNGAGAEKCDIESGRIDEELETAGVEGSATPRGNFQGEGSDEAGDEEVEPF